MYTTDICSDALSARAHGSLPCLTQHRLTSTRSSPAASARSSSPRPSPRTTLVCGCAMHLAVCCACCTHFPSCIRTPIPQCLPPNPAGPVQVVVSMTFDEIVMDPTKVQWPLDHITCRTVLIDCFFHGGNDEKILGSDCYLTKSL